MRRFGNIFYIKIQTSKDPTEWSESVESYQMALTFQIQDAFNLELLDTYQDSERLVALQFCQSLQDSYVKTVIRSQ